VGAETLVSVSFQSSNEAQAGGTEDCTWTLGWLYPGTMLPFL